MVGGDFHFDDPVELNTDEYDDERGDATTEEKWN